MLIRACVVALALLGVRGVAAEDRSPPPPFTGAKVYVSGVDDTYDAVRAEIAEVEAESPQTYYLVVVKSSGEGEFPTRTYVDELYQAWQTEAPRIEKTLDPNESVVIVLAVDNRQLAVHVGQRLQDAIGLNGQTIDRELVGPKFTPYAKAGNYSEGLAVLVREFNNYIKAKQAESAQQNENALATAPLHQQHADGATAHGSQGHTTAVGQPTAERELRKDNVPGMIGVSLATVMGLAVGIRWWWSRTRRRKVRNQLQEYKTQVVAINDALDAIQKRHKMLPFTDTDYIEPMTGETLALYSEADTALSRYRQRWLELMDAWEKAQALLDEEGILGTKRLKAAAQSIVAAKVADAAAEIERECVGPLDRLEQGHERATELSASIEREQQAVARQCAAVQAVQLATSPYQTEIDAAAALAAQGRQLLKADPIGAQTALSQAIEKSNATKKLLETVLRLHQQVGEIELKQRTTLELAGRKREEGLLLVEEAGNPDAALADTAEACRAAREALNRGQADIASEQVERASQAVDSAGQAIEQTIAARVRCLAELPACRAETERLRMLIRTSAANRSELDRDFAPESWREVAGHLSQAVTLLDAGERQIAEAATASNERVQHYLHGAELLTLAKGKNQQTAGVLAALDRRLGELRELRQRCQALVRPLREQADRVADFLRRNSADRPRANQRYQAAVQLLGQASGLASQPRADWPRLQKELEEVGTGLTRALEMAQQDVRLADQAAAEIAESQRAVMSAKSWYSHGFSADVGGAESQLAQARRSLQSQAYEDAIAQASAARQSAQAAQQAAVRRVELMQMQQEEERRRLAASQQVLAAGAAIGALSAMNQASAASPQVVNSFAPPEIPSPPPSIPAQPSAAPPTASPSSQTSWNSSSSQSSW